VNWVICSLVHTPSDRFICLGGADWACCACVLDVLFGRGCRRPGIAIRSSSSRCCHRVGELIKRPGTGQPWTIDIDWWHLRHVQRTLTIENCRWLDKACCKYQRRLCWQGTTRTVAVSFNRWLPSKNEASTHQKKARNWGGLIAGKLSSVYESTGNVKNLPELGRRRAALNLGIRHQRLLAFRMSNASIGHE
jgi:hypothetical protein